MIIQHICALFAVGASHGFMYIIDIYCSRSIILYHLITVEMVRILSVLLNVVKRLIRRIIKIREILPVCRIYRYTQGYGGIGLKSAVLQLFAKILDNGACPAAQRLLINVAVYPGYEFISAYTCGDVPILAVSP